MPDPRPTWDAYFLTIAEVTARRASCRRAQHGCVIVDKHRRIVATGYNGSPSGLPHCLEAGCRMVQGHCLRCRHAETNAVIHALQVLPNIAGCTVYVTGTPCEDCARALIREGVARVVYAKEYGSSGAPALFAEAGVTHELMALDSNHEGDQS